MQRTQDNTSHGYSYCTSTFCCIISDGKQPSYMLLNIDKNTGPVRRCGSYCYRPSSVVCLPVCLSQ